MRTLMTDESKELTAMERRSRAYKDRADPLMLSAMAYEREGKQVKANEMWAKWTSERAAIRVELPDVVPQV
jgi:hypothetical protein